MVRVDVEKAAAGAAGAALDDDGRRRAERVVKSSMLDVQRRAVSGSVGGNSISGT